MKQTGAEVEEVPIAQVKKGKPGGNGITRYMSRVS